MPHRVLLVALAGATLGLSLPRSSALPAQYLPVFGGSGGTSFSYDCGAGRVMTGLGARTGGLVDYVIPFCQAVMADGTLWRDGAYSGPGFGGSGGTWEYRACGSGQVVVGGGVASGWYVDRIQIACAPWDAARRRFGVPRSLRPMPDAMTTAHWEFRHCANATQPVRGIRGRAHSLVDAFGLVCDEP